MGEGLLFFGGRCRWRVVLPVWMVDLWLVVFVGLDVALDGYELCDITVCVVDGD